MYHAMQTVGGVDEYHWRIAFDNQLLEHKHVADLLNKQAETIEVLREWIRDCHDESNLTAEERGIVVQKKNYPNRRVELAKRRIAALEGM